MGVVDASRCVSEVAGMMLEMVVSSDQERAIGSIHHESLPHISPQAVVAELRVCYGRFPKLSAAIAEWSEVDQPDGHGTLYRLTPAPGGPSHYFVIADNKVRRVVKRRR